MLSYIYIYIEILQLREKHRVTPVNEGCMHMIPLHSLITYLRVELVMIYAGY